MKFEAAIFDMDGLLLDSEKLCMECFLESCRSVGFGADPAIYINCIGSNVDRTKEILIEGYGDSFPYDEIHSLWKKFYLEEVYEKPVPLKQGAKELLRKISDFGVPIGIATSTPYDLALIKLKNSRIFEYFEFVIAGDQVSKSKPDPEIYFAAAQKHKVGVEQCIAFEDSENGVRAAYSAGVTVIQVPDIVEPTDNLKSLGHKIVDSLCDVELNYMKKSDSRNGK